ncbi:MULTISPECIES: flagellar motor protein MotB [unclassified Janthinobacterium]|uniref:flagellar motor protein MotB n=1 Tax=unclassified Janthinobacterium TaxID=2610881 RepID=UPI0016160477|nr:MULTISPECIES: flagellar motor protein MotB [unclassified Janthinobacterium]MBB5608843.1 chemotaxis protein MotB [Janthinobacterium sp. S3T4]MBB5615915.1 chemotaxis protein MotB [Janthinobacterium sp. S3M3]
MADEGMRPIIVKRIKKTSGGHHGGAWKIAYADFVTAMMAFFLLMWLLGSTSKGDLNGISEFFKTPLKVAMAGGSGSGESNSVIQGGGQDFTRKDGEVRKGAESNQRKEYDLNSAKAALEREEGRRLQALKARIEATIDANPLLKKYKNQLLLDITSEGLRIQIVDEQNRPMFALANANLQPYTKEILHAIGSVLNEVPNRIGLSGHTDSTPYMSDAGYSNWELSADRANASRRELIIGGMSEEKVLRVVGLGSAAHLDKLDPFNPINRRISIIVMNKRTEENVLRDGSAMDLPATGATTPQAVAAGVANGAPPVAAPSPGPAAAKK